MVPLRRRPDGARREYLPHCYAIAATALNSTLLLCCRPVVLTLLLRSPAFCSALSADFAVFGWLLPVEAVHGQLPFSRATRLPRFAASAGGPPAPHVILTFICNISEPSVNAESGDFA